MTIDLFVLRFINAALDRLAFRRLRDRELHRLRVEVQVALTGEIRRQEARRP